MNKTHTDLLLHAPPSQKPADTWARLCCEEALTAVEHGCYGVGAVLVNEAQELLCSARNQVFSGDHYDSAGHAEMLLLNELESTHPQCDRNTLTLYTSLQPCLMCYGRILLAGIPRVYYLAHDKSGGFNGKYLPEAWAALASRTSFQKAEVSPYWINLAGQAISTLQNRQEMRQRVLRAWRGNQPD